MKNNINLCLTALCATLFLAAGCRSEMPVSKTDGTLAVHLADTIGETRASYGSRDGKFSWDRGDEIAIHYTDGRFTTYEVTPDAGDPSVGTVKADLSSTVSNTRDFYAVYPADIAVATAAGDVAPQVRIPSSYDISDIVSRASRLTSEYSPVPMVAKNVPGADLDFRHVGGLLRLTVKDVAGETVTITVTFDQDVTGVYPVNVDDPDQPFITTRGTSTDNVVTFTIASSAAGIGEYSVSDVILNVPVPCGTYHSLKVALFDSAGELLDSRTLDELTMIFRRHHGKRLAFAEQTVQYVIRASLTDPDNISYEGGIETFATDVNSYLDYENGDQVPIPFHVEFSDTGGDGTWSRTSPSWLVIGPGIDYSASIGLQNIQVIASPQENILPLNPYGIPLDDHTNALRDAEQVSDYDLSRKNVATGALVSADRRNTANSYLVQAPGTYRFPVVYGNALKNGAVNESAFRGKAQNGTWHPDAGVRIPDPWDGVERPLTWYMGRFVNHLGQGITTPYIPRQLAGSALTAQLLWMDAPGLISNVSYEAGNPSDDTDDYISFEVTRDGICQGNAVIAVLADGVIAWSWHIWVTDADMTRTELATSTGYRFSTTNLGWVDTRKMEEYEDRTYYLRLVQDVPGGAVSDVVTVHQNPAPTRILYGNAPYYGIGRKDPIPGYNGDIVAPLDKPCYPTQAEGNPYYPIFGRTSPTTVPNNIQNPHVQTIGEYDKYYSNLWNSTGYSHRSGSPETVTTKTIYDPSPVGYAVPSYAAFHSHDSYPGFRFDNTQWKDFDEMGEGSVSGRTHGNLFFPALGIRNTIFQNLGSMGYYHSSSFIIITSSLILVPHRLRFDSGALTATGGDISEYMSVRCTPEDRP